MWFYWGLVRYELVCFWRVWCLLVWFGMIWIFCYANLCFTMWFECELFLNDLEWCYWALVISEWVCFWCGLVSFDVVWWNLYIFMSHRCFMVCLSVIYFWMIWSDFAEVWLDLSGFIFGVVWCVLVWFVIVCAHRCSMVWFVCDLILNDLVWFYWGLVSSEFVCFWCGLVSFGVVWCDFYIC